MSLLARGKRSYSNINCFMKKVKKSGFIINKSFNIVSRFLLSGIFVISFFYVVPIITNFANKNFSNKEFTNNSKNILNNTLNKDKIIEEDSNLESNERDLLYDILGENNSEINLVRYTTSEIDSLFKEVNYTLENVRDTKLVKPVDIGLLPNEIKKIENTKKRKDMFIKIVLPLIVKENSKIRVDRKRLFAILNNLVLSILIFVFSFTIKGKTIFINMSFLFFVLPIFLISLGNRPISTGLTNFVSLTSFKL